MSEKKDPEPSVVYRLAENGDWYVVNPTTGREYGNMRYSASKIMNQFKPGVTVCFYAIGEWEKRHED